MKKWTYFLFGCLVYFCMGLSVYATGASLYTSSNSVMVGDTFTVSVGVSSAASWNIQVNVSGPAGECGIHEENGNSNLAETDHYFSTVCTALGEGVIHVVLNGEVMNAEEETSSLYQVADVMVIKKEEVEPSPVLSNEETIQKREEERSNISTLNSIKVDGYDLIKKDDTHYTLTVNHEVQSIVIRAEKTDAKATVSGDGEHSLNVGENSFLVVVTAENGETKTYSVVITRRGATYKLNQLEDAIRDTPGGTIEICLEEDDILTSNRLEMMRKSKRNFQFTMYDKNNVGIYSWIFNGANIDTTKDISTLISFNMVDREDFDIAMEFKEGILLNFLHRGVLPNGTRIRIYVGDHYLNGDSLTLYLYDPDSKSRVFYTEGVEVVDGYVSFDLEDGGVYFLTKASFKEKKSFNIFIPISIVEGFIIVLLLFLYCMKKNTVKMVKEKESAVCSTPKKKEEVVLEVPNAVEAITTTPEVKQEDVLPDAKEKEILPEPVDEEMPKMPVVDSSHDFTIEEDSVLVATPITEARIY